MGLLADLLGSVRSLPPYVATHAVAGRRFTAVAGAPPDGPQGSALAASGAPAVCGLAYTGQWEADPGYDAAGASRRLTAELTGRPLLSLAELVEPRSGRPDVGAAALN